MLGKIFKRLYSQVFINLCFTKKEIVVLVETLSGEDIIDSEEKRFATKKVNDEVIAFLEQTKTISPYFYISAFDMSLGQGAFHGCEASRRDLFFEQTACAWRCYEKNWIYFTQQEDIQALQKKFEPVGIDFIFSPFLVLIQFFQDKIDTFLALFVLVHDELIYVAIFDNGTLQYAKVFEAQLTQGDETLEIETTQGDIDLEFNDESSNQVDIIDDLEALDDFANIEDLDQLDEIDEFSDTKDLEEELAQEIIDDIEAKEADNFSEDYQRFVVIQKALHEFYEDDLYESDFIQSVYVADSVGLSNDFKRYLEEELFLSVYMRQCDLMMELCEIAKREVRQSV